MKTKLLFLAAMVLFAITQHLHAQTTCGLYEVPLNQRIDRATLIVEAKVLSSESFQPNPDEIFTRHRLEVFKLFKGSLPSEIEVITYGGEVNGLRQTYTNLLTLHPGEQGVFFLIPSSLVSGAYQAYASSQGMVKYVSDDLDGKVEFTRQYEGASGGATQIWYEPLDSDYLVWTDTLIRVLVPSNTDNDSINSAGTGDIRVWKRDSPFPNRSDSSLMVRFALKNQIVIDSTGEDISVPVQLIDHDSLGGYLLRYNASFLADTGAVQAFERALVNWRCTSQIRLTRNDTVAIGFGDPPPSRILYSSLPVGAVTTLARTTSDELTCVDLTGTNADITALSGFLLRFNSNLAWHTDVSDSIPAGLYDLESRALHELGHVHQLFHVNNSTDLMYFTSLTPTRRIIQANDEAGGLHQVFSWSAPALAAGYECSAHVPVPLAEFDSIRTSVEDNSFHAFDWKVFPNPADDIVHVELQSNRPFEVRTMLLNLQGRVLQSHSLPNSAQHQLDISTASLADGIYLLLIQTGNQYQSIKVQVQH